MDDLGDTHYLWKHSNVALYRYAFDDLHPSLHQRRQGGGSWSTGISTPSCISEEQYLGVLHFFCWKTIWVFPKRMGFPQIIHYKNRVFHYFHHPFWGVSPYFLEFHPFGHVELLVILHAIFRNKVGPVKAFSRKQTHTRHLPVRVLFDSKGWCFSAPGNSSIQHPLEDPGIFSSFFSFCCPNLSTNFDGRNDGISVVPEIWTKDTWRIGQGDSIDSPWQALERFATWWFQTFFIFIPLWGRWSKLTNIFQMGWRLKLPTRFGFCFVFFHLGFRGDVWMSFPIRIRNKTCMSLQLHEFEAPKISSRNRF